MSKELNIYHLSTCQNVLLKQCPGLGLEVIFTLQCSQSFLFCFEFLYDKSWSRIGKSNILHQNSSAWACRNPRQWQHLAKVCSASSQITFAMSACFQGLGERGQGEERCLNSSMRSPVQTFRSFPTDLLQTRGRQDLLEALRSAPPTAGFHWHITEHQSSLQHSQQDFSPIASRIWGKHTQLSSSPGLTPLLCQEAGLY